MILVVMDDFECFSDDLSIETLGDSHGVSWTGHSIVLLGRILFQFGEVHLGQVTGFLLGIPLSD